jgi:hypothetical protein
VATLSAFLIAIRIIVELVYATQKSRFKFELFLDYNHNLADVNRIHDYIVGLYNIGFPAGWSGHEQLKRNLRISRANKADTNPSIFVSGEP